MKILLLNIYLIIFLLALSINPAIALRCGNDLIQEGDTTSKVKVVLKSNGGEIVEKEYISSQRDRTKKKSQTKGTVNLKTKRHHTSGSYTSSAVNVEKWLISAPSGYGRPYCYELTFAGSVLKEIGSGVECK